MKTMLSLVARQELRPGIDGASNQSFDIYVSLYEISLLNSSYCEGEEKFWWQSTDKIAPLRTVIEVFLASEWANDSQQPWRHADCPPVELGIRWWVSAASQRSGSRVCCASGTPETSSYTMCAYADLASAKSISAEIDCRPGAEGSELAYVTGTCFTPPNHTSTNQRHPRVLTARIYPSNLSSLVSTRCRPLGAVANLGSTCVYFHYTPVAACMTGADSIERFDGMLVWPSLKAQRLWAGAPPNML